MAVTNTLKIRQANSSDVDTAVKLLLLSAHRVLTQIFGNGDKPTAEAYLTYAWQHKRGQYGSDAHWVAVDKDTPVGLITVWHNTMPKDFGKETLHSLNTFFGIDEAGPGVLTLGINYRKPAAAPLSGSDIWPPCRVARVPGKGNRHPIGKTCRRSCQLSRKAAVLSGCGKNQYTGYQFL